MTFQYSRQRCVNKGIIKKDSHKRHQPGIIVSTSMPQKSRPTSATVRTARARPVKDSVTAKQQAGQFPSVGMTLRSYQYDSGDYHRRPGGRGAVVVNGSRWNRFRRKFTLKRTAITLAII